MAAARDWPFFHDPFIAMAHRGGSELEANRGLENTVSAFAAAVDLGFTHLETDVHLTRDGRLIAFHDDRLDRCTDGTGLLADLTLAEVRRASVGGHQIPTLDELLDTFTEQFFNIDLKAPGTPEVLAEVLRRHGAEKRVCVGSFSSTRLARFRRASRGRVATSMGPIAVGWTVAVPTLPRWVNAPGVVFQVPVRTEIAGRMVRIITPGFLETVHRSGRLVHVWTIDDPEEMNELIDLGVDGLITDRPDLLREVCRERGLWVEH